MNNQLLKLLFIITLMFTFTANVCALDNEEKEAYIVGDVIDEDLDRQMPALQDDLDVTLNEHDDGEALLSEDGSLNESNEDEDNSNEESKKTVTLEEENEDTKLTLKDETNSGEKADSIDSENKSTTRTNDVLVQKAKVVFKKVDEKGDFLPGAVLQILDKNTKEVIAEWTSSNKEYEVELAAGEYTLHEEEAPEGYVKSQDSNFKIEVIIKEDVIGNVTVTSDPVKNTTLYYVTINEQDYEVYCINQGLQVPNGNEYTGKILMPDQLRNLVKQDTTIDTLDEDGKRHYTLIENVRYPGFYADSEDIPNYDVSDQSMTDQELYDKTLDIIYHRNMVNEKFPDLNYRDTEIRFITEYALKNYLNARITTAHETIRYLVPGRAPISYTYYMDENGEPLMDENGKPITKDENGNPLTGKRRIALDHKFYLREYVYIKRPGYNGPTEGAVNNIIISPGNGDSFGQISKGMSLEDQERYAKLYYYLIGDDNEDNIPDHPEDMQLYIYSPSIQDASDPYQSVLGVAGFFKDVRVVDQDVVITNTYSHEEVSVTVQKVWDDNNNQDGIRPQSVKVKLNTGDEVILSEDNDWTATISNLPKYKDGKKIEYTWSEEKIDGYELSNSLTEDYVTTLYNKHEVTLISFDVTKKWDTEGVDFVEIPKSVTIHLLHNGEKESTVVLDEENGWSVKFNNMPKYANGKEIVYEVIEEPVKYFETIILGNTTNGFIVNNHILPIGNGEEPPKEEVPPYTGIYVSNSYLVRYLIISITTLLSIIGLSIYNKEG